MRPFFRFHRDFRCNTNSRAACSVMLGAVATIVLFAFLPKASAQTGFGVQRLSGNYRPPLSNSALALQSQYPVSSSNPAQAANPEFVGVPAPAVAAPAGKVASQAVINNPFSRKEKEKEKESQTPIPSVVRLIAFEKNGQSFGSGSYIGNSGEYGLILSNWHVVNDCDGLVHVHFPNGFSSFGAVIDADKKWDLATIVISKPPTAIVPMPIARTVPVPGEPLWIAGHGPGVYRLAGGRCVRYLAPEIPQNGTNPIYEIVELSVSARQGDSGGPILNQNGELAGVLFGSDMIRNTAGSYCGRVSQFLLRATPILGRLPARPEVYFASIEKEGPKRQLRDTINIVPADAVASVAAPSVVDIAGSSSSSFGVPSSSRRYIQSNPPTSVTTFEKTPTPTIPQTPNLPNAIPSPNDAPPPTGPIQKAVWTKSPPNVYGSIAMTNPSTASAQQVVQTGLNTTVTSVEIPGDPFAEDRSMLNPLTDSTGGRRNIRETGRQADFSKKYAAAARSPYTLPSETEPGVSGKSSSPSLFVVGGFLLIGLLVVQAIRLIRTENESSEEGEDALELPPVRNQQRKAA